MCVCVCGGGGGGVHFLCYFQHFLKKNFRGGGPNIFLEKQFFLISCFLRILLEILKSALHLLVKHVKWEVVSPSSR